MVEANGEVEKVRLDGWKSIARYFKRDRATVMRWEAQRGLPVHRTPGGGRASIFAFESELAEWLDGAGEHVETHGLRRRHVLAGLIVVTGLGAGTMFLGSGDRREAEVRALLGQARILFSQNTKDTQNQAVGLAIEATKIVPGDADTWGLLGYFQSAISRWRRSNEASVFRERGIMHGQKALADDPGNAKGELALAAALPMLGTDNWLTRANGVDRSLERSPDDVDVLVEKAWILRFTGHCAEASKICSRVPAQERSPLLYNIWARAAWAAGNRDLGFSILHKAGALYPNNKMLWHTRMEIAAFSGDLAYAQDIIANRRGMPDTVSPEEASNLLRIARVLGGERSENADDVFTALRERAPSQMRLAVNAMRFASMTERLDEAFALADAYYFGKGFTVDGHLAGGLFVEQNQRHTNYLFEPPTAAMRRDRRFEAFVQALGLDRFWRLSGQSPDYRSVR